MSYKELRKALIDKLDITPQAVYQQADKIRGLVPMTTEQAVCIIAQRNGIKLDKYLNEEEIHLVRELLQQVTPLLQLPTKKVEQKTKKQVPRKNIINIGKQFKFVDPLLPLSKLNEANEMSDIFPYLYVLENSIREFIDRIMTTRYGTNWWDSQAPKHLRDDVSIKMTGDKRDSWHQRRGDRPIDYLDLKELPRLMNKIEEVIVPDIIPDLDWFRQLVKQVYKSRCVVCHMNPLDKNNVDAVVVWFKQWEKQLDAKKDLISNYLLLC
jgi:predicted restriction endonuclease